jgi:dihydrofolate reductase
MAKLVYGMQLSLDGYVDHMILGPPCPALADHFNDHMRNVTGAVCGRRMYDIMSYWDEDQPDWDADDHTFAALYRSKPKYVASRPSKSLGPNATLLEGDLETAIRKLKSELPGELDVAGPALAASLSPLNLIDEYRLYLRPVVLGRGTPFFAAPRTPLRLVGSDRIGDDVILLTYVPA